MLGNPLVLFCEGPGNNWRAECHPEGPGLLDYMFLIGKARHLAM